MTPSLILLAAMGLAADGPKTADTGRVVLVEIFVSQGCDLCPKAELLLGALADEFGPDRIVPVAFHVDYFDDPWKDPYSSPLHSRRELEYSRIYAREHGSDNEGYLYLTPLLMVDGRVPMVGSNEDAPTRSRRAIREALARRPEVTIDAKPSDDDRTLVVEVAPRGTTLAGKSVLVELITTEDGLETDVQAGELNGKRYRARHVVRSYAVESVRLPRGGEKPTRVELAIPAGAANGRALIVVVQDEKTGRVHQTSRIAPSTPVSP